MELDEVQPLLLPNSKIQSSILPETAAKKLLAQPDPENIVR